MLQYGISQKYWTAGVFLSSDIIEALAMANSSGGSNFAQWWDGLQVCGMMLISSAKTDDYNFGRTHGKPATSSQIFLTKASSTNVWEQSPIYSYGGGGWEEACIWGRKKSQHEQISMLSKTLECPSLSDFVVVKGETVLFMTFPSGRNRWICLHREYDPGKEHSSFGKKFLAAPWAEFVKDCYWKNKTIMVMLWCGYGVSPEGPCAKA